MKMELKLNTVINEKKAVSTCSIAYTFTTYSSSFELGPAPPCETLKPCELGRAWDHSAAYHRLCNSTTNYCRDYRQTHIAVFNMIVRSIAWEFLRILARVRNK